MRLLTLAVARVSASIYSILFACIFTATPTNAMGFKPWAFDLSCQNNSISTQPTPDDVMETIILLEISTDKVGPRTARWGVMHRLRNGSWVSRGSQYDINPLTDVTVTTWRGVYKRNRQIEMFGSIEVAFGGNGQYDYTEVIRRSGTPDETFTYQCRRVNPDFRLPNEEQVETVSRPLPRGVTTNIQGGQKFVTLNSEIYDDLADLIKPLLEDDTTLKLRSPGGKVFEALSIGKYIEGHHVNTWVPRNATCSSACFLIFIHGVRKFADVTSRIGVHGTSVPKQDGAGRQDDPEGTIRVLRLLGNMRICDQVIGKMARTPSTQMTWLDASDLRCLNVEVGSWGE